MKFVLTCALALSACGPLTRVQEAETTDNRRTTDVTVPPEGSNTDASSPMAPALRPAPTMPDEATPPASKSTTKPEATTPESGGGAISSSTEATPSASKDDAVSPSSSEHSPAPTPEPVVEELEIEERTGSAENFSEHALIFDLDEYGKDKRQIFALSQASAIPEWVSGLGFLFPETPHPVRYDTNENLTPFRSWAAHAALRLFQYQKQKSTVFRLTLFGEETTVDKEKGGDDKGKVKDKGNSKNQKKDKNEDKDKKKIKARSRLVLELSIKNGRPLLQIQTKVAGKKAKNARVKGKARLPANQELHLVASLKGNMLRLFTGTHLIGEANVETLDEKWTRGELVIGASHDHGKAPFVGFIKELEFADSLPLEYQ